MGCMTPAQLRLPSLLAAIALNLACSDRPGADSGPQPLCPTCVEAGGDTSDLGGGSVPSCRGYPETRTISLERADALGFDLTTGLDSVEGHYEVPVRWSGQPQHKVTMLTLELRRTGLAQLHTYSPLDSRHDRYCFTLPLCRPAFALAQLQVTISTDDGSLAGTITVEAGGQYSSADGQLSWDIEHPSVGFYGYDGSTLQGRLDLQRTEEATDQDRILIWGTVLRGSDGLADRADLTLRREHQTGNPANDGEFWEEVATVYAEPADGCMTLEVPLDASCDPWASESRPTDGTLGGNPCCSRLGSAVTALDASVATDVNTDAGTVGDAGLGADGDAGADDDAGAADDASCLPWSGPILDSGVARFRSATP